MSKKGKLLLTLTVGIMSLAILLIMSPIFMFVLPFMVELIIIQKQPITTALFVFLMYPLCIGITTLFPLMVYQRNKELFSEWYPIPPNNPIVPS